MKRFRFRLETALRLRHIAEQQAQASLSEAERALAAAQEALALAKADHQRHLSYCARLQAGRLDDIALLAASSQYTLVLEDDVQAQQGLVQFAIAKRDEQLLLLRTRRQEREALEKLREKQRLIHLQAEATEEQAWLDEVAVLRWGRT